LYLALLGGTTAVSPYRYLGFPKGRNGARPSSFRHDLSFLKSRHPLFRSSQRPQPIRFYTLRDLCAFAWDYPVDPAKPFSQRMSMNILEKQAFASEVMIQKRTDHLQGRLSS
jgi:hypothetical protein